MTIFAQTPSNDLELTNGRLTLLREDQETALKLRNRVRLAEGEWFLDLRVGMPYFKYILVKNPDFNILSRIFRASIESVAGVEDILDFKLSLSPDRHLTVEYIVKHWNGSIIEGGEGTPFIWEGTG